MMHNKYGFREPLNEEPDGTYITAGQMQFFLNRRGADKKFLLGHPEFFEYFYKCAIYNIIWDKLENDPDCAILFWDEEEETIGVKFPAGGTVMKALKEKKVDCFFGAED